MGEHEPIGINISERRVTGASGCPLQTIFRQTFNSYVYFDVWNTQSLAILTTENIPLICMRANSVMNMDSRKVKGLTTCIQRIERMQQGNRVHPARQTYRDTLSR